MLEGLETEAREGRKGLWADPQLVPPWEWRKGRRDTRIDFGDTPHTLLTGRKLRLGFIGEPAHEVEGFLPSEALRLHDVIPNGS